MGKEAAMGKKGRLGPGKHCGREFLALNSPRTTMPLCYLCLKWLWYWGKRVFGREGFVSQLWQGATDRKRGVHSGLPSRQEEGLSMNSGNDQSVEWQPGEPSISKYQTIRHGLI